MLYRSFTPDLEVRSDGDGRTIVGIAVPYGRTINVPSEGIRERFARGAFNHQLRAANRIAFARDHLPFGGVLIGATKLLRDDAAGLYGEWRVSRTAMGDETLELVRDGALRELSVGFKERRNRMVPDAGGPITERVKADASEVAVVMAGAYGKAGAVMTGVRSLALPDGGPEWDLEPDEDPHELALRSLEETRRIIEGLRPLPLL
jgi:HK97 family phage prohead protease